MSTLTSEMFPSSSCDVPRAELNRNASVVFILFASLLAAFVFTAPIVDGWTRSSLKNYDNVDAMDTSLHGGTLDRQFALGCLGLFGLLALAWPDGKTFRFRGLIGAICIAYLAWCVASCLWSDDLAMTLRRCIALACEIAAGLAIAKRASARQFVWIVFFCTLVWLGLGIAAELSLGTFRPGQQDYRFAGIFHPNEMGINCALLTLSSLYLVRGVERGRQWLYMIASAGFAFLLFSGSRAALGAMVASIAVLWFITAPTSRKLLYTMIIGLVCLCIALLASLGRFEVSSDVISLGREDSDASSLTGRAPLWRELREDYACESPLVGHGYGAFWTTDHIAELSKSQAWPVASTHSAYLDLLLNVGYVGAVLCLMAMVLAWVVASRIERQYNNAGYGFIAMLVVYGLAAGIFETTIGTTWYLSFFGICGVCFLFFQDEHDADRTLSCTEVPQKDLHPRLRSRTATA